MDLGKAHVALDFDGVLCDSAAETGVSGWRAGRALWSEWTSPEPPPEALRRFVAMRPYLETGYQAIPLMRLAWENVPLAEISGRVGERCAELAGESGVSREELVALFGDARDRWMAEDLDGWLGRHRFYPGTIAVTKRLVEEERVSIVTTKQERFAAALLRRAGVPLERDRLYGLEDGRSKEDVLVSLLGTTSGGCLFVEDRLATLLRVAACEALGQVGLLFAEWGYGTAADRDVAAGHGRIRSMGLADFGVCVGVGGGA